MNTPMDIYSLYMDIPFDVAAYCRGHKFSTEAVNLARAIRDRQTAEAEIARAEARSTLARQCYESALTTMKQKMERDPK